MRFRFLYFLSVLFVAFAFTESMAQRRPQNVPFVNEQTEKPLTDLEVFQNLYGVALIKGYTDLPRVRGTNGFLQVSILDFRSAGTASRLKGVMVEVTIGERLNEKARSFIEYGELDNLIKGITYVSKVDKGVTTLQSLEAAYTTKGEFSISNFFGFQGDTRVAVTAGRYEQKTVILDSTAQTTLLAQFQQAKSTLDEF